MRVLIVLALCGACAFAKPVPTAVTDLAVDGDVTTAHVGAMQVIVRKTPGKAQASIHLYIKGGARNWTAEDAGVEALGLAVAVRGGAHGIDADELQNRLSAAGASLSGGAGAQYSTIASTTLLPGFDVAFDAVAQAFLDPILPELYFDVFKRGFGGNLEEEDASPRGSESKLTTLMMMRNTPFANRPNGEITTIAHLQFADVARHLAKIREASRLVLVVVGDVDPAKILEQTRTTYAGLKDGDYKDEPIKGPHYDSPGLATKVAKLANGAPLPTNFVFAGFSGPGWHDPDVGAATVAMHLLQEREFEEVRTKRNLSYAPGAGFSANANFGVSNLSVSAVDVNTTMKVMFDTAKSLRDVPVEQKDLDATKAVFATSFLMQGDTTDGQASMLGTFQIVAGDWRLSRTLPGKLGSVTASDVAAFAKKYFANPQMVVVGDPTKVDPRVLKEL